MLSGFAVVLVASCLGVVILATSSKQREALLQRLGLTRQKSRHHSLTPLRELSAERQGLPPDKSPQYPNYESVFPPSRRHVLGDLKDDALEGPGKTARELGDEPPSYDHLLPDNAKADDEALLDHVTATGFSLRDVKRLGDFPDYATLSGIPLPSAYKEFDIKTALPRPYRPFRWAYHQTMSLTKMEPDWWLELDRNYVDVIRQRRELFQKHGEGVLQALPGSELACKELMEMSLQFLCARYPHYFHLDAQNKTLHNEILQTQTDLQTTAPLHVLLHNLPEDFALMLREPQTGLYSLRGGLVVSSLGWNLASKAGLRLHEIHARIPDYRAKMQFSMDRYFAKQPTDRAIQRGSWGLEIDRPLYMPPGVPHERLRERQDSAYTMDRIHLRVDWQTLRRLPLSGAVVFNFKGLFTPMEEFRDEAYIPSLVLQVLREGRENLMEYKGTWHTEHVAIPALEAWEREQVEAGLMEEGWEPHTLDESPFFPGWEEKWRRQQGF
ncbi:hypothetical protein BAUCODRAFT_378966 [Lecanosticta acicola]|uniref:Alpha-1,2-mannosyltransferase n=1 Tax=Lecanosticta acicola TaxID=111012 RepID=A0AAI9EDR1_9PEZI|nr:hypothetical protein BAUCODRAFT_378966 [Lecanosticta acicola]